MPEEHGAPYGPPTQVTPRGPKTYLEVMTKAVFQSGMSWAVIHAKWDGFKEAFEGFDVEHVASLTPKDVDELAKDTRIIRNRRKIEATIHNAQQILGIQEEFGSVRAYIRSFDSFDDLLKDAKKRFKFLGNMGVFYWTYVVKEKVPDYDDFAATYLKR